MDAREMPEPHVTPDTLGIIESLLDQEKLAQFKRDIQVGDVITPDTITTVTPSNDVTYVSIEIKPGEVCPQCHERKPSEAEQRKKGKLSE